MLGYDERADGMVMFDFGGLVTDKSEFDLPGNSSPELSDVDLIGGGVSKRGGIEQIADLEAVVSRLAALYSPVNSNGFLYAFCRDGNLYRTDMPGSVAFVEVDPPDGVAAYPVGDVLTELAPYLDANGATTNYPCLYVPRPDGPPIVLQGDDTPADDAVVMQAGVYGTGGVGTGTIGYPTATSGAGPLQDWDTDAPRAMRLTTVGRGERLMAFRFAADPARVDYSELAVPGNFLRQSVDDPGRYNIVVDGGYFYINKGDDDEIIDCADMYAYRLFMKRRAIFAYQGDPGGEDWLQAARFDVGVVGRDAWARVGNDLYFWSDDGPRRLSAVQEYGDLQMANLAEEKIKIEIAAINPEYAERMVCLHDATNSRVIWYVPAASALENNTAYVYYYNTQQFSKWGSAAAAVTAALAVRTDVTRFRRIIGATGVGLICEMWGAIGDLTEAINAYYVTRWMSPNNDAGLSAHALWVDVIFGNDGRGDCQIEYEVDMSGVWVPVERIIKTHGGSGARWGHFKWNDGTKWNTSSRQFVRFEITPLFNLIRFRFSSNSTRKWGILGLKVEARTKGARA